MAEDFQPALLGDISQARGNLELARNRYPEAAAAFRQAREIARLRNLPFLEVVALGNLGNVAMWEEHYDEAIDRFRSALEKSQNLGTQYSRSKALGNMGWSYSVLGDFENAEDSLIQAEQVSTKAGLQGDTVRWLNKLGEVYVHQRRLGDAERVSEKALDLALSMDDKGTAANCLNTAAEIALAMNRLDLAENHDEKALAIQRAGLDQSAIFETQLIAGRIEAGKGNFLKAEEILRKLLLNTTITKPLRWEVEARLAELKVNERHPVEAETEFLRTIDTFQAALDSIGRDELRISFLNSAIEFYDAYVGFLISQKRPLDALKIADLSRAQTLEHGLSGASSGKTGSFAASRPQDIARRLNATLLFYWLGEQRSYLWAITPTKVYLFTLPARAEIDAAVKSYLESFTDPRDPLEAGNADGKKLYATLIQPVEKLIAKNSRVVILADGSLNSLNFESLIVPGPKPHYWIEDATVLTANSLSLLSRTSLSAPPKSPNLFLVGDALTASPDFPPLPQAGKEVGLVESYYPADRRSVLTGAQATASHFLNGKPEEFSYVHFATHGTASTMRPLESAVILSPEGDAYKLYARDIVQHPLKAYLVTISACNGAGMRTYAGEGLVGLSWAFLRAGAHNVIAGLWEVSNASTPQLMDELYKGLNAGQDPATALRNAKLTLVHSSGNYRKPFYWAPFQLYTGS
jgi:CHAT domain-containing protein